MIDISHLSKKFGDALVVSDLSFHIDKGEIVGFLGPNGAGKTTTMRMITGFLLPSKGDIYIGGKSILEDSLEIRKKIGYLPENNPLYPDFTVEEYLAFQAGVRGISGAARRKALHYAVTKCGLEDIYYKTIGTLSKGLKQRVGLASAILHQPEILILDEPTSGLDPRQTVEIRELLSHLGKEHTILFSSHIMQEVEAICNRVLIINNGQLVAEGDPKSLSSNTDITKGHIIMRLHLHLSAKDAKEILPKLFEVQSIESSGRGGCIVLIEMEDTIEARHNLMKVTVKEKLPLLFFTPEKVNLEEVFLELTS